MEVSVSSAEKEKEEKMKFDVVVMEPPGDLTVDDLLRIKEQMAASGASVVYFADGNDTQMDLCVATVNKVSA